MKEEEQKKFKLREFFSYMKRTYKYAKSGKKYLFLFLVCNVIISVISIVAPILSAKQLVYLSGQIWKQLIVVVFLIFVIEISRHVFNFLCGYAYNKFYFDVRRSIQIKLARETLKITTDDLNNNSSGIFIERINADTDNITDIFVELIDYLSMLLSNIGILISVAFINIYIFISYVIFVSFLSILNKKFSTINYKNRKAWKKEREKVIGFTSEIVRGAKDIKILNAEESFLSKADKMMNKANKVSYHHHIIRKFLRLIIDNIRQVFDLYISLMSVMFLMNGTLDIAAALIIKNYQGRILDLTRQISDIFDIVSQYNLAANRIFGILEEDEFEKEKFGDKNISKLEGNIEFKDVNFGYDDKLVLKDMNFKINANETVSFVGMSGAGKSTIFNLISALYYPDKGSILLDNNDIRTLNKDSIRGNLSIISQNPYIYNMTIKENLQIIKEDATDEEIKRACKMACLEDFINSLEHGYDTLVGEGGVTLSGGQRQRLAIARAFLLETEIILFDEATSALDNKTQLEIRKAIDNMKGEYTVLIIAHRLSTVINSDKIFVLEDGKIVDVGTHKKLLKSSKAYKKLYATELEDEK